jgi:hypothetical protein
MTSKSIQGRLKMKKDDMARKVQSILKNFTEDFKLLFPFIRLTFKSLTTASPCNSPV